MNNTTTNSSSVICGDMSCIFTNEERDLIVVSLFSIAAISLTGNIPIVIAFLFSSKRRNSSNLSTLNLAVSDVLITVFCIPFVTLNLYVFDGWVFGSAMCHLVTFVQNTAINASLLNLLTITCEKFLAVQFPFHLRLRKKLVCHFMPATWIIAIAFSTFYAHFRKLKQYGENNFKCIEEWPDDRAYKISQIFKATFFFFPLLLIIVLHSITMYTLYKGRNTFQLQQHRGERNSSRDARRKNRRQKKAVKIILVTLVSIIACWGPFHILSVIVAFKAVAMTWQTVHIGYAVCVWLLFFHCSVFPFIYFFFTQKGRETITVLSVCLRTCRMPGGSNTTSLLLDNSNNHGSSFKGTGRYSSWRRGSTALNESRL